MEIRYIFVILSILVIQTQFTVSEEANNNKTEAESSPRLVQDSYLKAYATTRSGSSKSVDKRIVYVTPSNQVANKPIVTPPAVVNITTPIRREDNNYDTGPNAEPGFSSGGGSQYNGYSSGYDNTDSYFPQSTSYGPPKKYGVPSYNKQPTYNYGPPDNSYGPPSNQYGPVSTGYGAPMQQSYGVPYGVPSFFDKFSLKFDLLTLAKIILKIVIFKKIVKFIAIICLLLFIPKLIHYKKGNNHDEDEERLMKNFNTREQSMESINILTAFVQQAIDTYSLQQQGCENVGCRVKRVLDKVDEEYTFSSMVDMFKGYEE